MDSNLNANRFESSYAKMINETYFSGLNVTEASLNELLTSISISALGLGLWQSQAQVNATEYISSYQFSRPINIILPYALCLGIGLGILLLGLILLRQNRVAATDGGFLQVTMATKGNTKMEELVNKQGFVSTVGISQELKELRVRYGELIDDDNDTGTAGLRRRYGFGTVEETLALKKGK